MWLKPMEPLGSIFLEDPFPLPALDGFVVTGWTDNTPVLSRGFPACLTDFLEIGAAGCFVAEVNVFFPAGFFSTTGLEVNTFFSTGFFSTTGARGAAFLSTVTGAEGALNFFLMGILKTFSCSFFSRALSLLDFLLGGVVISFINCLEPLMLSDARFTDSPRGFR